MPKSAVWLRGIAALVGTMIVIAIPLSAQARCANGSKYCNHPVVGSRVSNSLPVQDGAGGQKRQSIPRRHPYKLS